MLNLLKIIRDSDMVNLVLNHKLVWQVLLVVEVLLVIFMDGIKKQILLSLKRIYERRRRDSRPVNMILRSRCKPDKVEELLDLEEAAVQRTPVVMENVDEKNDNHKDNETFCLTNI